MLQKTVFVITYGRSGSTLLQNMINALPGHILRGENNNVLSGLAVCWNGLQQFSPEQISRMKIAGPLPSGPHQPWFGYEGIDPDLFGRDLARTFVERVLRPEADTRVAGFKEIRWHQDPELFVPMLEFLRRFMPNARFIFNTRDHAQVCRSGWWKTMPEDVVRQELEMAEALYATWQAAHPECSLALHYNDYVASPEAWRPLFSFLDEPFNGALIEDILGHKLMHLKWKGAQKN